MQASSIQLLQESWGAHFKESKMRILYIFQVKFFYLNSLCTTRLTDQGARSQKCSNHFRTLWKLSRNGFKRFYSRSLSLNVLNLEIKICLKLFPCFIEKPSKESLQGVYAPWSDFGSESPSLFYFSELVFPVRVRAAGWRHLNRNRLYGFTTAVTL